MSRKFLAGFFILIPLVLFGQAVPLQTIEVMGMGETRELAIEDAKRNAVERVVGLVINSETITKNYALLSDKIVSRAVGYVRKFEVIQERVEIDDVVEVTIRAEVGEILDDVLKDQMAMETLLSWMDKPRILVAITESNMDDKTTRFAEAAIAGELLRVGFNVVEGVNVGGATSVLNAIEKERTTFESGGAELILAGSAVATEGNTPKIMKNSGMISVGAIIQAKVYQSDNRSVLAVHSVNKAKPHINASQAGALALGEAGKQLAHELIADVVKRMTMQQSNFVPVEIVVENATFKVRGELLNFLKKQRMVKSVNERGLMDGVFICEAEIEGKAVDLATVLDGFTIGDKTWNITGMTGRKIVLSSK